MAILDALGAYLVSQGQGTLATNIFLDRAPETPDACVTLYESAGGGPDHTFGAGVYAIDHQRIRVICRAARNDYPAARDKAVAVRAVLGAIRDTTLSGVKVLTMLATSEVYPLNRDGDDRALIGCDYTVWLG
jgi:hypothetical protein